MMDVRTALAQVVAGEDLTREESGAVMRQLMTGEATDAQIGAFLVALRAKGETTEEIVGAATTMRALATRVDVDLPNLVDTCGTGGSATKVFNVSTAAAFVTAAAGAHVAKHGNRAMTSKSGSADLLEAGGVSLDLSPEQVGRCIAEVGVGFLFAQKHHSAMRHVAGPRREIGVRTLFNVLGPMTNPAGAPAQVIGVFDGAWQQRLAEVLRAFKPVGVSELTITKMDECVGHGSMLNAHLRTGYPLTYYTTGQRVPEDIEAASAERLVRLVLEQWVVG